MNARANWPQMVIFDCDGVLVDSELIANRVFLHHLQNLGLELHLEDLFERFVGRSMAYCLQDIERILGRSLPENFLSELDRDTFAAFDTELRAVEGVVDLLDRLDHIGLSYCVASSGSHGKMDKTLGLTGLLPRLRGRIFSASEVARAKPYPDIYLHAAQRMQRAPEECVVIEDSPTGVRAGVAAGMTVFGYAGHTPAAKLAAAGAKVFRHMNELPACWTTVI
jgi:HAD superfamily hydrolase (TIGR01509 family)